MPTTTASDDEDIFAAIEAQVMAWETMEVSFERIGLAMPGRGWQVSFKVDAKNAKGGTTHATGGGATLREAVVNAFVDRATRRLQRT